MAKYRAGVIGYTGRGDYGHGLDTVYLDIPEVEIVAVADADSAGLESAGERLSVAPSGRYQDYRQMLEQEQLDLVSVAPRWLDQHHDMIIAAAEAGVRGIYCEKPFARTLKEADAMIVACDRSGTKIAVAHQSRFHPLIKQAKQIIADGLIGEVKEIHGAGKQDQRGGGQDLIVLGTHTLDLMCFFFGPPRWVQAYVLQDGHDAGHDDARWGDEEIGPIVGDHLLATYAFENGVVGHFTSRRGDARFGKRSGGIQISGSEGILAFRGGYLLHYAHPCWTPAPVGTEWEVIAGPEDLPGKVLNRFLVQDLIQSFEENREPVASGRDARWALEMILGVYAAHRHGRTYLPMEDREHPLRDWLASA